MARWRALSIGILSLGVTGLAEAAPLEIEWSAVCGEQDDFEGRVEEILGRAPEELASTPLDVKIQITRLDSGRGYRLHLLTQHQDRKLVRQLVTRSCDEAVEAAAVLLALTLDPTRPPVSPEPARLSDHSEARRTARSSPWLGIFGGASVGEVPALTPLFDAGIGLELGRLRFGLHGVWLGTQAKRVTDDTVAEPRQVGGRIGAIGGGLSACYSPVQHPLRVAGCGVGYAGIRPSQGVNLDDPKRDVSPWLSVGLRAEAGLPVTRNLGFAARADLLAAARRPRFVVDQVGEIYRPSALAVRLAAGVEIWF